jgi:hypothetical protein
MGCIVQLLFVFNFIEPFVAALDRFVLCVILAHAA